MATDGERIAIIETEIKHNNEMTLEIHDILVKNGFIAMMAAHGVAIKWLTWGQRLLFASLVVGIFSWLIKSLL